MPPTRLSRRRPTTASRPAFSRAASGPRFVCPCPANFKGKYVWTLNYGGVTQVATASIDQNYSLDVGDPEPPGVKGGPDVSVPVSGAARLAPTVTAPPAEPVPANAGRRAAPVARRAHHRLVEQVPRPGNGHVRRWRPPRRRRRPVRPDAKCRWARSASPVRNPPEAACGATTAHFSAPGTYWLRVVAAERSASNAIVKVVVTP